MATTNNDPRCALSSSHTTWTRRRAARVARVQTPDGRAPAARRRRFYTHSRQVRARAMLAAARPWHSCECNIAATAAAAAPSALQMRRLFMGFMNFKLGDPFRSYCRLVLPSLDDRERKSQNSPQIRDYVLRVAALLSYTTATTRGGRRATTAANFPTQVLFFCGSTATSGKREFIDM